MGMDPTRQHKKSPFDYVFVVASVVAAVALLAWALLG